MGTGIAAAIPLEFTPDGRFGREHEYFTKNFFDNFVLTENEGNKVYTIKPELLVNNYKSFFKEFYDLIEDDTSEFDALPNAGNMDEFMDIFDKDKRNSGTPFIYSHWSTFSTLGCRCSDYWLFYSGSYKAYLEVYSTLNHMEKMVSKAVKNPLANAVKFGIFG
jgi:hypothetical protein